MSPWPIDRPPHWTLRANMPMTPREEAAVQQSIRRDQPYGTAPWQKRTASRLGLAATFRQCGRPIKKQNNDTRHHFWAESMAQFRRHSRQNVRVFNVDDAGISRSRQWGVWGR